MADHTENQSVDELAAAPPSVTTTATAPGAPPPDRDDDIEIVRIDLNRSSPSGGGGGSSSGSEGEEDTDRLYDYPSYSHRCLVCELTLPKDTNMAMHRTTATHIRRTRERAEEQQRVRQQAPRQVEAPSGMGGHAYDPQSPPAAAEVSFENEPPVCLKYKYYRPVSPSDPRRSQLEQADHHQRGECDTESEPYIEVTEEEEPLSAPLATNQQGEARTADTVQHEATLSSLSASDTSPCEECSSPPNEFTTTEPFAGRGQEGEPPSQMAPPSAPASLGRFHEGEPFEEDDISMNQGQGHPLGVHVPPVASYQRGEVYEELDNSQQQQQGHRHGATGTVFVAVDGDATPIDNSGVPHNTGVAPLPLSAEAPHPTPPRGPPGTRRPVSPQKGFANLFAREDLPFSQEKMADRFRREVLQSKALCQWQSRWLLRRTGFRSSTAVLGTASGAGTVLVPSPEFFGHLPPEGLVASHIGGVADSLSAEEQVRRGFERRMRRQQQMDGKLRGQTGRRDVYGIHPVHHYRLPARTRRTLSPREAHQPLQNPSPFLRTVLSSLSRAGAAVAAKTLGTSTRLISPEKPRPAVQIADRRHGHRHESSFERLHFDHFDHENEQKTARPSSVYPRHKHDERCCQVHDNREEEPREHERRKHYDEQRKSREKEEKEKAKKLQPEAVPKEIKAKCKCSCHRRREGPGKCQKNPSPQTRVVVDEPLASGATTKRRTISPRSSVPVPTFADPTPCAGQRRQWSPTKGHAPELLTEERSHLRTRSPPIVRARERREQRAEDTGTGTDKHFWGQDPMRAKGRTGTTRGVSPTKNLRCSSNERRERTGTGSPPRPPSPEREIVFQPRPSVPAPVSFTTADRTREKNIRMDNDKILRSYFKKMMWYELPVAREEGDTELVRSLYEEGMAKLLTSLGGTSADRAR